MFKLLLFLVSLSAINCSEFKLTLFNTNLRRNERVLEPKTNKKGYKVHILLKNCSGVIDANTFSNFPKLSKLTIWYSNIEEISTVLPVKSLMVFASNFPNLTGNLQENLPSLQTLVLLGNKDLLVDTTILKKFVQLKTLHISEATFKDNCLCNDWFAGLNQLEKLSLADNGISCITDNAFTDTIKLEALDLSYNCITSLDGNLFKQMPKLKLIGLQANPIEHFNLDYLSSQKGVLKELDLSWEVLKNNNISAESLRNAFPNIKIIAFSDNKMPDDVQAERFCAELRQKGVSKCGVGSTFDVSSILGYSMNC